MPDDNKRQHDLKLWLTDREWIDLCKQAVIEDRKPGEMGRVFIRRSMYGIFGSTEPNVHQAISADQGRET